MSYGNMTLGELRKIINGLDDSVTLVVVPDDRDFRSWEPNTRPETSEKDSGTSERFKVRFVGNVYTAGDEDFTGDQFLVICIG